jgi:putative ABC transport system permease protein
MAWHDRLFRALLKLFPAEFRGDFGDDMAADFGDQRRAARGRRGIARLWLRTTADVVRRAPLEHLDLLRQDVLYALRLLRRHPGATTTAIVSLTVGIGLNAAIYSVVSDVLWRNLPFAESDRLVIVGPVVASDARPDWLQGAHLRDVMTRARTLDKVGAGSPRALTFVEPGPPVFVRGVGVTPTFFDVLGVRPVLGRHFSEAEYDAAIARRGPNGSLAPAVALISDRLWRTRFGSSPDAVGARIRVARGDIIEVVGVMGPEVEALGRAFPSSDLWFPADVAIGVRHSWITIARLAPGRTTAEASAEVAVIGGTLEPDLDTKEARVLAAVGLLDHIVGGVRTQMLFLFGAVACVLLVTCANVANLFLAHAAGRRDELGVRAALGASRIRLLRQAVTESLVVSLIGGLAGFAIAVAAVPLLIAMAPADVPRLQDVGVDWSTFVFTFGVAAAIGIVCALVAALPLRQVPKAMGRMAQTSAPPTNRFRHAVTVAEIALALMLTVAATLMVRTVRALNAIDLGFDPRGVVSADLSAPVTTLAESQALHSAIIDEVKSLPGVTHAGIGLGPLSGGMFLGGFRIPGNPRSFDTLGVDAVSPGYFEALGARLRAGRFFEPRDASPNGGSVILLNETAARLFFPDANPIGRTIVINDTQEPHIIGVIADLRGATLEGPPGPMMYQLSNQSKNFLAGTMLIRVDGEDDHLAAAIGSIIHTLNREAPFRGVEPLAARIDRAMAPRLFVLRLIGLFSLVGLALAVIGVYSVLAQFVGQRVPEIGVRMAFGATVRDVLRLVFGQGARLVAGGFVLGIAGAVLLRDVMATMLYGVGTLDPLAYSGACVLLLAATAAACAVPARRAARLDPVVALRSE